MGLTASAQMAIDPRTPFEISVGAAILADDPEALGKAVAAEQSAKFNKSYCPIDGQWNDGTIWAPPLFYAIALQRPKTLKFLLDRPEVDVNILADNLSALDAALTKSTQECVINLLSCPRINVNKTGRHSPPFLDAFQKGMGAAILDRFLSFTTLRAGYFQVLMSVIECERLDVPFLDKLVAHEAFSEVSGPAFLKGLHNKDTRICLSMIGSSHFNPNMGCLLLGDNQPSSPLFYAIQCDNVRVAHALLQHPACDPNISTDRWTACVAALNSSHPAIVAAIAQHPKFNPALAIGDSPLTAAVDTGRVEMVDLLLKLPTVNPNIVNRRGTNKDMNPLCVTLHGLANVQGEGRATGVAMLNLLLAHPRCDPRLGSFVPLTMADRLGDSGLLSLLRNKLANLPEKPEPLEYTAQPTQVLRAPKPKKTPIQLAEEEDEANRAMQAKTAAVKAQAVRQRVQPQQPNAQPGAPVQQHAGAVRGKSRPEPLVESSSDLGEPNSSSGRLTSPVKKTDSCSNFAYHGAYGDEATSSRSVAGTPMSEAKLGGYTSSKVNSMLEAMAQMRPLSYETPEPTSITS